MKKFITVQLVNLGQVPVCLPPTLVSADVYLTQSSVIMFPRPQEDVKACVAQMCTVPVNLEPFKWPFKQLPLGLKNVSSTFQRWRSVLLTSSFSLFIYDLMI